eukprot:6200841-Amphidinium_carterae.1
MLVLGLQHVVFFDSLLFLLWMTEQLDGLAAKEVGSCPCFGHVPQPTKDLLKDEFLTVHITAQWLVTHPIHERTCCSH